MSFWDTSAQCYQGLDSPRYSLWGLVHPINSQTTFPQLMPTARSHVISQKENCFNQQGLMGLITQFIFIYNILTFSMEFCVNGGQLSCSVQNHWVHVCASNFLYSKHKGMQVMGICLRHIKIILLDYLFRLSM